MKYFIIYVIMRKNFQTIFKKAYSMNIIKFDVGDTIVLKKKHPCGCDVFSVLRCGSDIRVKCTLCERDMTFTREKLEKSIKRVTPKEAK